MKIILTKHVLKRLEERNIKGVWAKQCAKEPDFVFPAGDNKKAYLKDLGKNYLKVIIVEEGVNLVILTAYWFAKSRLKRYNPN
ncbi:MAG: hypothetical protein UU42_C0006G0028 [Candidatus Woesebacteria bacterium GW2011_GWA1_41_13b]|uniref:DUF4258 domain-containing protein n=1 Tax=Candidatus Woesebacteria bacterium GW2011_GWA1_41_13b TaxID=1618555 RepID=A0A0G0UTA2_9BACT|nr:MAG: hypothetical protein UU42_C0006G0028 [Candidatus Woesebacteria bacterium GW2011_GWA1_41_13b]